MDSQNQTTPKTPEEEAILKARWEAWKEKCSKRLESRKTLFMKHKPFLEPGTLEEMKVERVVRETRSTPGHLAKVSRRGHRLRQEMHDVRDGGMTDAQRRLFLALLREKAYRRMMPVRIYEPLGLQEKFHRSAAPERLAIGSNRSGKTTVCALEVAWAVTGTHPYWPHYPKENGRVMCVSKNIIKIGEVIARKLLKRGEAMKMVKDPETGLFRAWRPHIDGYDRSKLVGAMPLLDPKMIKHIAWERKGLDCPKKITLHNGWEITFWSSEGPPPNGVDVDLVHFDEEITQKDWYDEMSARLLDRAGRFIWSATPQEATDTLFKLYETAQQQAGKPNPRVEYFHFLLDDCPYISPEDKEIFKQKAATDPDNYKVRVKGEFIVASHLVYPSFSRSRHVVDHFNIPNNWCRYIVLDPGYAKQAAIFFAVPPTDDKEHGGHVYIYDELYGRQLDVKDFCELLEMKTREQGYQAFLIDAHRARQHGVSGKTAGEQYAEQFALRGMKSVETKSDFHYVGAEDSRFGAKTLPAQISQVRGWLWDVPALGDRPVLRVFEATCPIFVEEMLHYRNKKDTSGRPTDAPDSRAKSEGPDCLRYACIHGVPYVEPKFAKRVSRAWMRFQERRKRRNKQEGDYVLLGSAQ